MGIVHRVHPWWLRLPRASRAQTKAGVVEHPEVFGHAGLLV
jgi:hypothetical protein